VLSSGRAIFEQRNFSALPNSLLSKFHPFLPNVMNKVFPATGNKGSRWQRAIAIATEASLPPQSGS
jgi:hypothetical protein